jgi:hypothetical protein
MGKAIIIGIVVFVATLVVLLNIGRWHAGSSAQDVNVQVTQVPEDVADALFEREVAAARALGFEEIARDRSVVSESLYRPVEVDANRCVAVVAAMSGLGGLGRLNLVPKAGSEVARDTDVRPVQHVQACFTEKFSGSIHAMLTFGAQLPERTVRVAILEAPLEKIGGNEKLNRGWVPLAP